MKIGRFYTTEQEHDSEKKIEKSPPWSDLPVDILYLIMGRYYFVDQIWVRAVCKSWRVDNLVPSIDKFPWLMSYNWDKLEDGNNILTIRKFFDPSSNRSYSLENANYGEEREEFIGAEVVASKSGWLLLQNKQRPFFLYNPFNNEIVKLPSFDVGSCSYKQGWRATFSTSPTSLDCVIFIIQSSNHSDKIIINTCRCGDTEWTTCTFDGFFKDIKDVVYSKGTFYCVFNDGKLEAFDVASHDWISYESNDSICKKIPSQDGLHMVESDGDLILICFVNPMIIFKFDWSVMDWVQEGKLGNRAVFIDQTTSCAISAVGETRKLANRVYYHGYISTLFYCLERRKREVYCEFYHWLVKNGEKQVWIECPHD